MRFRPRAMSATDAGSGTAVHPEVGSFIVGADVRDRHQMRHYRSAAIFLGVEPKDSNAFIKESMVVEDGLLTILATAGCFVPICSASAF